MTIEERLTALEDKVWAIRKTFAGMAPPPPQRKSFLELDKEAFRQSYMSSSGRELCLSCYHEGRQSLRAQVRAVFEKDPCNKGAAIRALVDEESP